MAERDHMVIGLVKELLGPRNGAFEELPETQDPRNEYIMGVLAPEQDERDREDVDADVDEVIEEVADDENQGAEGVIVAPSGVFSPALDPKAQPRSIGLSFILAADEGQQPCIDVCVSWARYEKDDNTWKRRPNGNVVSGIIIGTTNPKPYQVSPDVELRVRTQPQSKNLFHVSLYLLNQRKVNPGPAPATSDFMFQPQIRVHCVSGKLTSIDNTAAPGFDDPYSEDVELAMLYRDRAALARGHLCGAMWRDIDPERPHDNLPHPEEAPFYWVDHCVVSSEDFARFSPADARTEIIPCYPVEAPEVQWNWPDTAPEFRPLELAEKWNPIELQTCLEPLVAGYKQWIAIQARIVPTLNEHWQPVANRNLEKCRDAADRMSDGITWLMNDEQVRLAFCFANKAIALQSEWARKVAVPWRPFQLAFILLNIVSIADPTHSDREICDLLWFPTGGGKTEAYLGLAAFTLALRRIRAKTAGDSHQGGGVSVLSRYTLRLLTIQQFRRALGVITACEVLRVANIERKLTGWRPARCADTTNFLWGEMRFSAGMWVGGNVTPNSLTGFSYRSNNHQHHIAGAIDILQGVSSHGYFGPNPMLAKELKGARIEASGDPAQVLSCPACQATLSIPEEGLGADQQHTLHFIFSGHLLKTVPPSPALLNTSRIAVDDAVLTSHNAQNIHTISITFHSKGKDNIRAREIDSWWNDVIQKRLPVKQEAQLQAARPARPGYFLSSYTTRKDTRTTNNFEIYCPDPQCPLNQTKWAEKVPVRVDNEGIPLDKNGTAGSAPWVWQEILPFARYNGKSETAERIPIPAYTTDDQVYHRCPSMVIATVDKFARLAFEPKAAALFGNVTHYHARWGFYRQGCPPGITNLRESIIQNPPSYSWSKPSYLSVTPFLPPDLILQDELHLLEGPLGSMVGLYETAIDALCTRSSTGTRVRPKYIASTATVRQAENQIQSLFDRKLAQFPPSALDVDDRFFARTRETHPLESSHAGRLYVAVAGPGKGAQTPIVRIWSALLQQAYERRQAGAGEELDGFWTLVGYFNALRELAGAAALYRQDIRERIQSYGECRELEDQPLELSSRANSLALPGYLERLSKPWSEDAVLATSMFGTGVDVDRLGLMVVHGQPKTTSSYIQATGRVGRRQGGLVVTFFRVSRPRDLDHYEFFTGYHRMLYKAVEPVTVTPYAPRARERGLGPLSVALLRQGQYIGDTPVTQPWHIEQRVNKGFYSNAVLMAEQRRSDEVEAISRIFEQRAMSQPEGRRPIADIVEAEASSELDRWQIIANDQLQSGGKVNDRLVYAESAMLKEPERSVILGDAQHQFKQLPVAFENAPNSLRDVEATTQFKE